MTLALQVQLFVVIAMAFCDEVKNVMAFLLLFLDDKIIFKIIP